MDEEIQIEDNFNNNFLDSFLNIVNKDETEKTIECQKQMLSRFEKTNEMLLNCNTISQSRFLIVFKDLKTYKQQLNLMKKDLDQIHVKLKTIKSKISRDYKNEYTIAKNKCSIDEIEEE